MKTFRIRLVRDFEGKKEERFEIIEDEYASLAYSKAMKTRNSSEGWTPVSFEVVGETGKTEAPE